MAKKPTTADAHLILQLYDLRREAGDAQGPQLVARRILAAECRRFPESCRAMGTQENNWLRQVGGYWSMAASFVLQGVLNEELFLQPASAAKCIFMLAKVHPFLKELREKMDDPHLFGNIEKVITRSKFGRERLKFMLKRVEMMRQKQGRA